MFLVIERLPGVTLESVWARIPHPNRVALMGGIGRMMACVHRELVGSLADLPPQWAPFLEGQIAGCLARHTRLGSPEFLLRELVDYVREGAPLIPTAFRPVILTGEYTPFNLLVQEHNGWWEHSGMIDFGDAMIGPPEYDFLGPSTFLCAGNSELVRAWMQTYGVGAQVSNEQRQRWMTLLLLHRYSYPKAQIRIPGWEASGSIAELAEKIWP